MSDPMQRPDATTTTEPPRKGANPLVWILLLIALVAIGWYFLNQRGDDLPPAVDPAATTPTAPVVSEQEAAAERERNASAAREERRASAAAASTEASPVAAIAPGYPAAAMRNRDEGTVTVEADVDASGAVTSARVAQSSRSRDLDRAALEAVRGAQFKAATKGGQAVASTVRVPIEFKLEQQ